MNFANPSQKEDGMRLSAFTAAEWLQLKPAERIQECRRMAEEAREVAAQSSGEHKNSYLEISRHWDLLADEMKKAYPD